MTLSHSSGVILRIVLSTVTPALLTRMSSCPCCSSTSAMTRSQSSLEPMLPWWIVTPWSAYLSANCWAASRLDEYPAAMCTPRFISRSQMASPMPRIPPVTRATWPFISAMVLPPFGCRAQVSASAEHVLAGGVREDRVLLAAQVRRLDELARAGAGPLGPVLPPRAVELGAGAAPGLGVGQGGRVVARRFVPGLGTGRVDDAGDVPAAGQ